MNKNNLPKNEKEFDVMIAKMMSEEKPETMDEVIAQLEKINKLYEECFGKK
jgi:hypothetical protein